MEASQQVTRPDHRPRSHRRRKKRSAGRLGLAGAATGVIAVVLVAVAVVLLRSIGGNGSPAVQAPGQDGAPAVQGGLAGPKPAPKTGPGLHLTTPDGYSYTLAAASGGTNEQPLAAGQAPLPAGQTYAYIDYVLTNTGADKELLDFPGDLFVQRAQVPAAARSRCMPQPGVRGDMCTLPNHSAVIGFLDGSKAPVEDSGDQYMPRGASYLVRVATTLPVERTATQRDLNLYVWDARYISDRRAVPVPFPGAASRGS